MFSSSLTLRDLPNPILHWPLLATSTSAGTVLLERIVFKSGTVWDQLVQMQFRNSRVRGFKISGSGDFLL